MPPNGNLHRLSISSHCVRPVMTSRRACRTSPIRAPVLLLAGRSLLTADKSSCSCLSSSLSFLLDGVDLIVGVFGGGGFGDGADGGQMEIRGRSEGGQMEVRCRQVVLQIFAQAVGGSRPVESFVWCRGEKEWGKRRRVTIRRQALLKSAKTGSKTQAKGP